ncbi:MAG: hypothetical protein Q4D81_04070 [Eubacteriales bacterium]|nr:hypothetical protein [Eubacteriales bacterium]
MMKQPGINDDENDVCNSIGTENTGKIDPDKEMNDALGSMLQINTPGLDVVEGIVLLPSKLLLNHFALLIASQVLIPAYAWKEALMYAGYAFGSVAAGVGVELIKELIKNSSESKIRKKLTDIFKKEGLTIHSFSKGGKIPDFLLSHLHLTEGFDGAVSGDLISLHYRDYGIVCCNIALTQSPVDGFEDPYTQDDVQARKHFEIEDEQNVVYYGSVFMFFPGPAIEGNVRLKALSPIEYLKELEKTGTDPNLTEPEWIRQRMSSFHLYHNIQGENCGNRPETDRVFSQHVKEMVLQMEYRMRVPVTVYADQDMACLTIQDRVFDFDCFHDIDDPGDSVAEALYTKINSFKMILDTIIGPEGSEHTELLGSPADQRKSIYTPFLNPFHQPASPDDDGIRTYVQDLAEWSTDLYRFLLYYSREYQQFCKDLASVSTDFLTLLFEREGSEKTAVWLESEAGTKVKDSLTEVAVMQFRNLWNASAICEVRNICRKPNGSKEDVTFDIVVNPPLRKWEYLPDTNRRMVSMCDPSRFSLDQLNDEEAQRELIDTFRGSLKKINGLRYDVDYVYSSAMSMNDGQKYGMKPKDIADFCKWYSGLMAENMEANGRAFPLKKKEIRS